MTVINNLVFCYDGKTIKKHFLENGYEWININNLTYSNNYYSQSPYSIISNIDNKTKIKKLNLDKDLFDDNLINFSSLGTNPSENFKKNFNLSQAFYNNLV